MAKSKRSNSESEKSESEEMLSEEVSTKRKQQGISEHEKQRLLTKLKGKHKVGEDDENYRPDDDDDDDVDDEDDDSDSDYNVESDDDDDDEDFTSKKTPPKNKAIMDLHKIDRFGSLSDKALVEIISYLDAKEAVRTCILSKRWKSLWQSITKLKFKEDKNMTKEKRIKFMDFVEGTLLHHKTSVETFSLTCVVPSDFYQVYAHRVSSWMLAAVMRKVQRMILDLHFQNESPVFPSELFACESLTELRLNFRCDLRLPSCIDLKNLNDLALSNIVFTEDSVQRLFSGCPKLKNLNLMDCQFSTIGGWQLDQVPTLLVDPSEDNQN